MLPTFASVKASRFKIGKLMGRFLKSQNISWDFPSEEIRKYYDVPLRLIEEIEDELDEQSNFLEYAKQLVRKPDENLEPLGNAIEFYLKIICKIFILQGKLIEITDEVSNLILTKKASLFSLNASRKATDTIFDFIEYVKGEFKSDLIELRVGNGFAKELIKSAWSEARKVQTKGIESIEAMREGANEWDWINSTTWQVRNPIEYDASFAIVINAMTDKLHLSRKTKQGKPTAINERDVKPRAFPTKAELEAMKEAGITGPRRFLTEAEKETMRAARYKRDHEPKVD